MIIEMELGHAVVCVKRVEQGTQDTVCVCVCGVCVCVCVCCVCGVKQAASLKEHCGSLSCQLWLRAGLVEAQLFSGGISPVQHTALFPNDLPALAQGQDGSGGGGGCGLLFQAQNASTPQRHTGHGAFMAWTLL